MEKPAAVGHSGEVSRLLQAWGKGDVAARDRMLPLVYHELRRRAGAYLRRERQEHTLQPTALVPEALMRLIGQDRVAWQNRGHFFGVAAEMMRRILVDHARHRLATKRPGAAIRVTLDDRIGTAQPQAVEVLLLDQALSERALSTRGKPKLCSFVTSRVVRNRTWPPPCRCRARPSAVNGKPHGHGCIAG